MCRLCVQLCALVAFIAEINMSRKNSSDFFFAWLKPSSYIDFYPTNSNASFQSRLDNFNSLKSSTSLFSVALQSIRLDLFNMTNLNESLFLEDAAQQQPPVHVYVMMMNQVLQNQVEIRLERKMYSPTLLAKSLNDGLGADASLLVQFKVNRFGCVYMVGSKVTLSVHKDLAVHIPIVYDDIDGEYLVKKLHSQRRMIYGTGTRKRTLSDYHCIKVALLEQKSRSANSEHAHVLWQFPYRQPTNKRETLFLECGRKEYFSFGKYPITELSIRITDGDNNILKLDPAGSETLVHLQLKNMVKYYRGSHVIRFDSTTSRNVFTDNKNSSFTHQFPHFEELLGSNWHVALTGAMIPSHFFESEEHKRPQTLAIHTDMIRPSPFGNKQSEIIKVLQVQSLKKNGGGGNGNGASQQQFNYEATRLEFHPVARNSINTVSFRLEDVDTGSLVRFKNDFDIVRLNFTFVKF